MCRDRGLARQQVQDLAARVDEILQHLQAAAVQALELKETLRSAERPLAEAGDDPGAGITVTPVPAAHSDPA
ncbi:MAG TPA: hypothetical protein VNT75_11745 [Symbiobacteriaceae bacterium]|nr:hypothetical protein [Symbiobacteriaceae bacterium]